MRLLSAVAEVSALKAACSANKLVSSTILSRASEDWFGLESSKELFRAIRGSLDDTGTIPSWHTVLESPSLTKNAKRAVLSVADKSKVPTTKEHAQSLVATLNRYRQLRGVSGIYEFIGDSLEQDKTNIVEIIDKVSEALADARIGTSHSKDQFALLGRGNNATSVIKDILAGSKGKFVPSGFAAFDKVNSGFLEGSLVVLGANTGGGKTAAACNMLETMSYHHGIDVACVTLEMSKAQMLSRLMALRSEVPVHKVSSGKMTTQEKAKVKKAYKEFVAKLKETNTQFNIWEPDTDITIEDALLTLQPHGYKVILIDYISLLKGTDGDDQWKQLGRVARYAKIFAKNTGTIVVLLCQVSDDGKIKFARSIADHSNNCWLWTAPKESEEVSIYDINQVKARNQLRFKMRFESHNATGRIKSLEGDGESREDGGSVDDGYDKSERKDVNDADEE